MANGRAERSSIKTEEGPLDSVPGLRFRRCHRFSQHRLPGPEKALRRFSLRDIGADIAFDPLITGLERLVALGGEKALGGAYSMIEEFESNCPGRPSVNHPIVDLIGSEAGTKKVAVFSSNTRKTITRLLREIGIEELFDRHRCARGRFQTQTRPGGYQQDP